MFRKYDKSTFESIREQHNIFVLVGNGFDVAALQKYQMGKMRGKTSSYKDFFEYIEYYNLIDEKNILYARMKEDRDSGKSDWSDFEKSISDMYKSREYSTLELEECIDIFQEHFTRFLNDLVDSDVLLKLNYDAKNNEWAYKSLSRFLLDIPLEKGSEIEFEKGDNLCHYDLFYFVFANFNYTPLLDNYLFLDKGQFDPHMHKYADRNFYFHLRDEDSLLSSYVLSEVIHPHGYQDIPRSMLFGIDLANYEKGKSASNEKRLVKAYWAQYETKYRSFMKEAELFIIYGMSMGETDAWWYDAIYDSLKKEDRHSSLIIYKYGNAPDEEVKNQFVEACIRHKKNGAAEKKLVKNKIFIVQFEANNTNFLGFTLKDEGEHT